MQTETATDRRMLVEERRRRILQLIEDQGRVTVDELVREFGVSTVTVRSDLDALAEMGALQRSHGGAVRSLDGTPDYPVRVKEALHHDEKNRIGQAAARLIRPNQTVIFDSGSTTAAVARHLKKARPAPVTVVTNSLDIAADLSETPFFSIIMIGGLLRQLSRSFVGPQAEHMMRQVHANHLFLGVDGISLESGPSTPDILEAQLNSLMVSAADEVTVVCDASKFGRRSLSVICPMNAVHRVITDTSLSPDVAAQLQKLGIQLSLV